jgi:hypothetical protein
MYGIYETVQYGLKSVIYVTRILTLIYGIILFVLALLIFIIELKQIDAGVSESWAEMTEF